MLGKKVEKLEAVATRLEAVAARLDRHDGLTVEQNLSPVVSHEIISAAEASLSILFGEVLAALAAGERDRGRLLRAAQAPVIRALGAAPAAQQTSAARAMVAAFTSLLLDRLADLHQAAGSAPQRGAEP